MSGWLWLALFAAMAVGASWLLRVRGSVLMLVAAAAMLGGAGYALQGAPGTPGAPTAAKGAASAGIAPPDNVRDAMYGRFNADSGYVIAADAMTRSGDDRAAVRVLIGGINRIPNSYILWTELGSKLARHDGDTLSAPARFAFARAIALAPLQPGPYYVLGLAEIRAGDLDAARRDWRRALAATPAGLSYRPELAGRLMLLDRLIGMGG